MKKLRKKIKAWIKDQYDMYYFGEPEHCFHSKPRAWLNILYEWGRFSIARLICRWRGHKVKCINSYSSPDTGSEEHECERCGESWRIVYY